MITMDPIENVSQTASLYSQIAGVLAGFAFTALLAYMRQQPRSHHEGEENGIDDAASDVQVASEREAQGAAAVVLFSTLGALIICAVLYGVLAGGRPNSGNAYAGLLLYGPSFSLAVLSMFYAIGLAALPYAHLQPMIGVVRVLAGVTGPALSMILIAAAAYDICAAKPGRCEVIDSWSPLHPFGFGVYLTIILVVLSAVVLLRTAGPRSVASSHHVPTAVGTIVLLMALAGAAVAIVLDLKPAEFTVTYWGLHLAEAVTAVALETFAVLALVSLRQRARTVPVSDAAST